MNLTDPPTADGDLFSLAASLELGSGEDARPGRDITRSQRHAAAWEPMREEAEEQAREGVRRRRRRVLSTIGATVAVVALAGIVTFALLPWLQTVFSTESTESPSTATTISPATEPDTTAVPPAVARWLLANVPHSARLLAPADLAPELRKSLPGREVIEYFRSVGDLETADFVIVSAELNRLPAYHPARDVAARGTPVAVFDSGTFEVRQTSRGDPATTVKAIQAAGRNLSRQVPVRLTPEAWSTLVEGDVDARLITLLGRLAEEHTIDVASFERDAPSSRADAPARIAVLSAADSELVSRDNPRVSRLMADIDDLSGDVRPPTVGIEKRAAGPMLVIRYLLPVGTS